MASRIGIKAHSHHVVEKGLLFAMCLTILNLHGRLRGSDEPFKSLLKGQYMKAFQVTGFEDALIDL